MFVTVCYEPASLFFRMMKNDGKPKKNHENYFLKKIIKITFWKNSLLFEKFNYFLNQIIKNNHFLLN